MSSGEPASPPEVVRHFHPVLPAKALRKAPVRVEVAGQRYALFRGAQGVPAALLDRCPHRYAPLSKGRVRPDGTLACPYHGWYFDAQGRGVSPSRATQARCDVAAFQLVERAGYLWLAEQQTPPSALPEMAFPDYALAGSFSTVFEAPLHVALDNFSEDEHTPWVHDRLGWDEGHLDALEYECHNLEDHVEIHYRGLQRWDLLANLLLLRKGDFFHNDWVTRFDPVRTEYDIHWRSPDGQDRPVWLKAVIYMVPETPTRTRFHTFTYVKVTGPLRAFRPLVHAALLWLTRHEIEADARFIPTVAETPFEVRGMKLGRFDKPLAHQRKLLRSLYWGEALAKPQSKAG